MISPVAMTPRQIARREVPFRKRERERENTKVFLQRRNLKERIML